MVPVSGVSSSAANDLSLLLQNPNLAQQLLQNQLMAQLNQPGQLAELQRLLANPGLSNLFSDPSQLELLGRLQAAEIGLGQSAASSTGELSVDTSQASSGIPKASPAVLTPREDHTAETQQLVGQKTTISEQLEETEKDLRRVDLHTEHLSKRRQHLRQIKDESDEQDEEVKDEQEDETQAVPQVQQIIEENKKRKAALENSMPRNLRMFEESNALYIEPSDAPGIRELRARHEIFAPKLLAYVKKRQMAEKENQRRWEDEYSRLYAEWQERDNALQLRPDRQAKEAKWRLDFEATFKDLAKNRGDKERQTRIENRGGVNEYMAITSDEVDLEKKMRNAADVPPMMNCQLARRTDFHYKNTNNIHRDVLQREKARIEKVKVDWTPQDLDMFKNRLKIVGKNFANIAMFFPEKTVKDCIQCYYLLIKSYNRDYKSTLPKSKKAAKKKYRPPQMPTQAELSRYHQNPDRENPTGAPLVPDVRCSKCQQKCDAATNTVRVTRGLSDTFGKPDKKGAEMHICAKCYEQEQKLRSGRCLVKACFDSAKKLKPTKALPVKWKQMDDRQRAFILHDMGIPRDVTKTCYNCNKKILKRLDEVLSGVLDEHINEFENNMAWEDDEVARLLSLIEEMGTDDWEGIAEQMDGRDADECRLQYVSSSNKRIPESDDEDEEAEDAETRDNNADENQLEEETQDVPEDETRDRESAPVIDLSPDTMDTAPGPSVITATESVISGADLTAATTLKVGSITAGTPLRPSSVTILESTPAAPAAASTGIPTATPLQQPPGTAPPQSSSARATPQSFLGAHAEAQIKQFTANPNDLSLPGDPSTASRLGYGTSGENETHGTVLSSPAPTGSVSAVQDGKIDDKIVQSHAKSKNQGEDSPEVLSGPAAPDLASIRIIREAGDADTVEINVQLLNEYHRALFKEEQNILMAQFRSGLINQTLNPTQAAYAALQGMQANPQLQQIQAMQDYEKTLALFRQQQQQAAQQQQAHNQMTQQLLSMTPAQLTALSPTDLQQILQCGITADQLQNIITTKAQQQQQQRPQVQIATTDPPETAFAKFDKVFGELETAITQAKTERIKQFAIIYQQPDPATQNHYLQQMTGAIASVQSPLQAFQQIKAQIEEYYRQWDMEKKAWETKEAHNARGIAECVKEIQNCDATTNLFVSQYQQFCLQTQLMPAGTNMQQFAVIQATLQTGIDTQQQQKRIMEEKKRSFEADNATQRQRKDQMAKVLERIKERVQKAATIPTTLNALCDAISTQAQKEVTTQLQAQQRQRAANFPPTTIAAQQFLQQINFLQQLQNPQTAATFASLQQQHNLLAQAQAAAAQQQQQQQASTAQKLANAPVRKDNTWIAELEKQSRPQMGGHVGQQRQLLNTIGRKVIGEELAAQQLISPGQQAQQQNQAAAAVSTAAEPIKRKSGLETVVIERVPTNVRHPMHGSHVRRGASPLTQQAPPTTTIQQQQMPPSVHFQLLNKTPTSRSITGSTTTPLAVQTTTAAAEGHYQSPAQRSTDFDFGLRLPTKENLISTGLPKEPEVHRKQGIVYSKPDGGKTAESLTNFPFVCSPGSLDRPASVPRNHEMSALGVNQQQQMLVSPGLKHSPRMTRDTVPSTSVADVAHHRHKPGTTNGLLGEIEPMSPDSPKNAVSPATLGGEAQRPLSTEPRIFSMMDDVFFEDDGPVFRPISPKSCLYPGQFVDAPFEDISDEEPTVIHMET